MVKELKLRQQRNRFRPHHPFSVDASVDHVTQSSYKYAVSNAGPHGAFFGGNKFQFALRIVPLDILRTHFPHGDIRRCGFRKYLFCTVTIHVVWASFTG